MIFDITSHMIVFKMVVGSQIVVPQQHPLIYKDNTKPKSL